MRRRRRPDAGSSGELFGLLLEAHEVDGPGRAKVGDDAGLLLPAGKQRLPAGDVCGTVDVTGGNGGEPGLGDPAEELCAVEQLEAVGEPAQRSVA